MPKPHFGADKPSIKCRRKQESAFTGRLEARGIDISMDGRGRASDNIFIERLWRTVKYEEVYLKDYLDAREAVCNLKSYFAFYNQERSHQALGYQTPAAIYFRSEPCPATRTKTEVM